MRVVVGKKGLSPVIASVLMILLVIVLASIIFLWAQGFIGEQIEKFGKPIDDYCKSVEFTAVVIENGGYYIFEIVNKGNVGIGAFEIKMYYGGDSEVSELDIGVPVGESVSAEISLDIMRSGEYPDKIEVSPILNGRIGAEPAKRSFVCRDESFLLLDF